MPRARRLPDKGPRAVRRDVRRYTIDASVFVNAFNPHEEGHLASLEILAVIHRAEDPVVVPTLLLPEVAAAVARGTDDAAGALGFVNATAALPHLTLVALTPVSARLAADAAATHRLRGADAVYVAVARRYGTVLVSRDQEQHERASSLVDCRTPEEALRDRQPPARRRSGARRPRR